MKCSDRYVHSLLTRIEHLEAVKRGIPNTSPQSNETAPNHADANDSLENFTVQDVPDEDVEAPEQESPFSFDVVIPATSTAGRSRYWGSSSAFALTVELLQHAVTKGFIPLDDVVGQNDRTENDQDDSEGLSSSHQRWEVFDEEDIQALVRLYLVTLNTMYGFVDTAETQADIQAYLSHRRQPGFSPQNLHGEHAHRFFRISMMCAISCANQSRHQPHRAAQCLAYYSDAITCVEEVTSEATPASLQALLLLIVFCLFHPRRGDIWKLLDYACRLTIELGYHTEDAGPDQSWHQPTNSVSMNNANSSRSDGTTAGVTEPGQARSKLRRSTFWGLYAIERIVGQLFGRGSDLPETIITAEYPSSLTISSGISPLATGTNRTASNFNSETGVDQATLQSMSIAHHYRLVYLRSEIFRTMYLPASPPDLSLDWLRDKYKTLFAWRRELAVSDDLAGVATLTCDVGYDATMCFLFQPLLMKALKETQSEIESSRLGLGLTSPFAEHNSNQNATTPGHASVTGSRSDFSGSPGNLDSRNDIGDQGVLRTACVASDPFYSAINLICTYEKIIRAPRRSQLGTYPMTFMSAHYIYLAASTLLAYALLRLDGRVKTLRRMEVSIEDYSMSGDNTETDELDWGAFMDISSSCLMLLAWCVERWPGMLGMMDVYQILFRRLTRELIAKGIIR